MKKLLGIIVLGLLLSGCETTQPTISYHEHYNKCMIIPEASIEEIASCGKQKRLAYLETLDREVRGAEGDAYMIWVDLLAQQVKVGKISELEAKMELLNRQQVLISKERDRKIKNQQQNRIDWKKVAEQFETKTKDTNKRKCVKQGNSTFVCEDVN